MSARIIQANSEPFRPVEMDPVTLDIIENALRNAREEMDATLFRTAMSPGIREQGDAFPLIADHNGKMIVGQFGSFIDGFLELYTDTIEDGDVILLSDPYSCEGAISHNNDWLVLIPIYVGGRLLAWSAMFGHQTDVGGKVPGSLPTDGDSIFQEGLRIPPIKIYNKGAYQKDIVTLILHQSRKPQWCRSDLNALLASCRMAQRRVVELCERFGEDVFVAAGQALLARNRRAMSSLINNSISTDKVFFEDYVCDDGVGFGPYKIKCSMWREGDKVILDFAGTSPQSQSSINFYLNENMFKMFFGIYMIMVFDPQILFNDGFYDLVEVRIPEGSLLKPRFPAAVSCRTHALGRIFDILGGLLGQRQPEFLNAAGFSSSPHLMFSGYEDNGEWFQLFQIGFGGIPGRPFGDGPDGHSLWPGFTNIPNEFLERYFPLRIERYETVADSGGAGLNRGGNGIRTAYRFLADGTISIHDDRWFTYPWGVNGGAPGQRSRKYIVRADGSKEMVAAKADNIKVHTDDVLHYITWGGGGWGDPLQRAPEFVALEIRRGLISREGALDYGVVLDGNGDVDTPATEKLRKAKSAARAKDQAVFNFGPDIAALRASCEEETGLPAPREPVW